MNYLILLCQALETKGELAAIDGVKSYGDNSSDSIGDILLFYVGQISPREEFRF